LGQRARSIIGWLTAILVALFLAMSAVGKFMPETIPGFEENARQLGIWEIRTQLGILSLLIVILFLIPRTSTIGFILMVGYLAGALATVLTHGRYMDAIPLLIGLLIASISAYFRNPELGSRLFKKPFPV